MVEYKSISQDKYGHSMQYTRNGYYNVAAYTDSKIMRTQRDLESVASISWLLRSGGKIRLQVNASTNMEVKYVADRWNHFTDKYTDSSLQVGIVMMPVILSMKKIIQAFHMGGQQQQPASRNSDDACNTFHEKNHPSFSHGRAADSSLQVGIVMMPVILSMKKIIQAFHMGGQQQQPASRNSDDACNTFHEKNHPSFSHGRAADSSLQVGIVMMPVILSMKKIIQAFHMGGQQTAACNSSSLPVGIVMMPVILSMKKIIQAFHMGGQQQQPASRNSDDACNTFHEKNHPSFSHGRAADSSLQVGIVMMPVILSMKKIIQAFHMGGQQQQPASRNSDDACNTFHEKNHPSFSHGRAADSSLQVGIVMMPVILSMKKIIQAFHMGGQQQQPASRNSDDACNTFHEKKNHPSFSNV
ncbi:hypothetical protein J6590_018304 [Homalodisca vitripennis]|nr:hypothetical protein J6590_018304 [Homalodisca vitripennis]